MKSEIEFSPSATSFSPTTRPPAHGKFPELRSPRSTAIEFRTDTTSRAFRTFRIAVGFLSTAVRSQWTLLEENAVFLAFLPSHLTLRSLQVQQPDRVLATCELALLRLACGVAAGMRRTCITTTRRGNRSHYRGRSGANSDAQDARQTPREMYRGTDTPVAGANLQSGRSLYRGPGEAG